MLVVRDTKNVRAVQSSYYSSCPWIDLWLVRLANWLVHGSLFIVTLCCQFLRWVHYLLEAEATICS
jgi:hypothetical protein